MLSQILFYLMLAFFFTHELDAVKRHEWRLLPKISFLPDHIVERIFIWLHIPLFLMIFYYAAGEVNSGFNLFLSGFSVVHAGGHWLFRKHPACEFNNPTSWTLISATGIFGALHIISAQI